MPERIELIDFAQKFRLALEALNWSRTRCARELGLDKSVVSRWASGGAVPTEHNLTRFTAMVRQAVPRFLPSDWRLTPDAFAALFESEPRDPADPVLPAEPRGLPTIAVLAFDNMSADPNDAYFADGMSEDLITELSRLRFLLVTSRGSSFTYKGRAVDTRQIGQELGVRYVLEGSVRRGGQTIRINAQLIDAATGTHVWAERYDRALTDIFAVQDEITRAVSDAIGPAVELADRQRALRKPPDSLDAWEAFQRGQSFFETRDFARAEDAWRRAIALDQGFALPHACLAFSMISGAAAGTMTPFRDTLARAEAECVIATALDRDEALGHAILSMTRGMGGDAAGGRNHALRAVALAPGSWHAQSALAVGTMVLGEFEAARVALDAVRWATARGRSMRQLRWMAGLLAFLRGDYAASAASQQEQVGMDPAYPHSYWLLIAALSQMGLSAEAAPYLRRWTDRFPGQDALFRAEGVPWLLPDDAARVLAGLRAAGWRG